MPDREIFRLPLQRRLQAQIVQQRRPQQHRNVAHRLDRLLGQQAGFLQTGFRGGGLRPQREKGARDRQAQRGQRLADLVVQLARKAGAFVFLDLEQPGRQMLKIPPRLRDFLEPQPAFEFGAGGVTAGSGGPPPAPPPRTVPPSRTTGTERRGGCAGTPPRCRASPAHWPRPVREAERRPRCGGARSRAG